MRVGEALRSNVPPEDSIASVVMSPLDIVAQPWMLAIADSSLILSDLQAPHIHVFSALDGSHVKSFGRSGEGPGEFGDGPSPMRGTMADDSVWFNIGFVRRMFAYQRDEFLAGGSAPEPTSFLLSDLATGTADGLTRFGGIVSVTDDRKDWPLFALIHPSTGSVTYGRLGHIADERMIREYRGRAYLARLCFNPRRDLAVVAYWFAGRADVIDTTGTFLFGLDVPFPFLPYVAPDSSRGNQVVFDGVSPFARKGYHDCATTSRSVYLLYSGLERGSPRAPALDSEVHIFDWLGARRRVVVLDHPARGMAIPEGDSVLFTFSEDSTGYSMRRSLLGPEG